MSMIDDAYGSIKNLVIKFKVLPISFGGLKTRIAQVDAEIDGRVYRLYRLTEDEIKIVEGR